MEMLDEEMQDHFDEMLDDSYPVVKIGELTFYPSQILKNCDPIAYNIGMHEYFDFMKSEEEENVA